MCKNIYYLSLRRSTRNDNQNLNQFAKSGCSFKNKHCMRGYVSIRVLNKYFTQHPARVRLYKRSPPYGGLNALIVPSRRT